MKRTTILMDLDKRNGSLWIRSMMMAVTVLFLFTGLESSMAFWETPQMIEEIPEDAWNLQADVTSRINDYTRICSDPGIRKPGVDAWVSYMSYDDQDVRQVFVKNYRFNNKYPRDDAWGSTIMVSNLISQACWGQSIKGFNYVRQGSVSTGVPAASTWAMASSTVACGASASPPSGMGQ